MDNTDKQPSVNEKLMRSVMTVIDGQRAILLPMLQGATGQAAHTALRDDECVRKVATFCYPLLPGLLRLAVKEPAFVNFVLNNREKVLGPLLTSAL